MNNKVLDIIGEWSEVKLEILKKYGEAYSSILSAQHKLTSWYIDAFAGAGMHLSKKDLTPIAGSPINALRIKPGFDQYYFIDIKKDKIDNLNELIGEETKSDGKLLAKVHIKKGDSNEILINELYPLLEYRNYRRALCVIDPYGLHFDWKLLELAGKLKTVDIFLNFSIMDANMNALHKDASSVSEVQKARMTRAWGDDSWIDKAYSGEEDLFGFPEKQTNDHIASAFQRRLKEIGGFKYVPKPIAMENSSDSKVYYLYFASQKEVAGKIAAYIFKKYKK